MSDRIRLNKYISATGFCSRRKADEWIAAGKVTVNGEIANMGCKVEQGDAVRINGTLIKKENPLRVLAFYKPRGYTCTAHRGDASGIYANFSLDSDLRYVGRLDKDSEGLLLLTNDGDLCNAISKAKNAHEKEYIVTVDREVTARFLAQLASGVRILDANTNQYVMTRPCKVRKLEGNRFSIILTQGYNRQIRRMCEALHYRVKALKRIRVMNIMLGEMKPGELREVREEELQQLKMAAWNKKSEGGKEEVRHG